MANDDRRRLNETDMSRPQRYSGVLLPLTPQPSSHASSPYDSRHSMAWSESTEQFLNRDSSFHLGRLDVDEPVDYSMYADGSTGSLVDPNIRNLPLEDSQPQTARSSWLSDAVSTATKRPRSTHDNEEVPPVPPLPPTSRRASYRSVANAFPSPPQRHSPDDSPVQTPSTGNWTGGIARGEGLQGYWDNDLDLTALRDLSSTLIITDASEDTPPLDPSVSRRSSTRRVPARLEVPNHQQTVAGGLPTPPSPSAWTFGGKLSGGSSHGRQREPTDSTLYIDMEPVPTSPVAGPSSMRRPRSRSRSPIEPIVSTANLSGKHSSHPFTLDDDETHTTFGPGRLRSPLSPTFPVDLPPLPPRAHSPAFRDDTIASFGPGPPDYSNLPPPPLPSRAPSPLDDPIASFGPGPTPSVYQPLPPLPAIPSRATSRASSMVIDDTVPSWGPGPADSRASQASSASSMSTAGFYGALAGLAHMDDSSPSEGDGGTGYDAMSRNSVASDSSEAEEDLTGRFEGVFTSRRVPSHEILDAYAAIGEERLGSPTAESSRPSTAQSGSSSSGLLRRFTPTLIPASLIRTFSASHRSVMAEEASTSNGPAAGPPPALPLPVPPTDAASPGRFTPVPPGARRLTLVEEDTEPSDSPQSSRRSSARRSRFSRQSSQSTLGHQAGAIAVLADTPFPPVPPIPSEHATSTRSSAFLSSSGHDSRSNRSSKVSFASRVSRTFKGTKSQRSSRSSRRSHPYGWDDGDAPPLPSSSDHSSKTTGTTPSIRFHRDVRRRESILPLPQLIERAARVSAMLDEGKRHSGNGDGMMHRALSGRRRKRDTDGESVWSRWSSVITGRTGETAATLWRSDRAYEDGSVRTGAASRPWSMLEPDNESGSRRRKSHRISTPEMPYTEKEEADDYERRKTLPPIPPSTPSQPRKPYRDPRRRRRIVVFGMLALLLLILAVGLAIGLSKRNASAAAPSCASTCVNGGLGNATERDACVCICSAPFAGAFCQLDATPICLDGSRSCITPLARSLVDVAMDNTLNQRIDLARFATALATYATASASIPAQLAMLDLPNIPAITQPRRARWAQAVLLWDMASSEDFESPLRSTIVSMDFRGMADASGGGTGGHAARSHGYNFDFGSMTVSTPLVTWSAKARPAAGQAAMVDAESSGVLNSMTSAVVAAATQRRLAFAHYWNDTLRLSDVARSAFFDAIRSAPLVVPMDVSSRYGSTPMANILAGSNALPDPPSCDPSLPPSTLSRFSSVERDLFGYAGEDSRSLGEGCRRPHYAILNVFNLQTPFADSDPRIDSLPGQAIVLRDEVKSRILLHAGEVLAGGGEAPPTRPPLHSSFGSIVHLEGVLLDWLQLFSSPAIARRAIQGVINGVPAEIPGAPVLEATIFGAVPFSAVDHAMARIAMHGRDGEMLFGTELGNAFRRWALQDARSSVRWVLTATDERVAVETAQPSAAFEAVWRSAGINSDFLDPDGVCRALDEAGLVDTRALR